MTEQSMLPIAVQPVISYPREAEVGKTYLMTIDLQVIEGSEWQFEEEEYPIYCMVDSEPLFKCEAVGEPAIVLHRFGGSYGSVNFLLTATHHESKGSIRTTLINQWGVPVRGFVLDQVEVVGKTTRDLEEASSEFKKVGKTGQSTSSQKRKKSPKKASVEVDEEPQLQEVNRRVTTSAAMLGLMYAVGAYSIAASGQGDEQTRNEQETDAQIEQSLSTLALQNPNTLEPLNKTEQKLYDWLAQYIREQHHSPSIRQIMTAMGLKTPASIQARLSKLQGKGYITWTEGQTRTIRLLPTELEGLPILGIVAATSLIEVHTTTELEFLNFSKLLTNPKYFALRVMGHGMIDALIDHEDIVIMQPLSDWSSLKNGEIVAACVHGKSALAHYYLEGDKVILQPANPDRNSYPLIEVPADSVEIHGVLVAVWRGYQTRRAGSRCPLNAMYCSLAYNGRPRCPMRYRNCPFFSELPLEQLVQKPQPFA